jgi:DHA1 family tetracycline resistance protein-like MFS transporter
MKMSSNAIMTATLMITIAVDIMGLGLIFPIMPDLIFDQTHGLLPMVLTHTERNLYYGLLMAIWPLGLFLGAPYFGDMSDKIGRKTAIFICLLGTVASYVMCGIAVSYHLFWLSIACRFLAGLFGGNFTIAQALMLDISTPLTKARNLSMVTLAASMGFVVGPLITSVSTLPGMGSFFNLTTPFYVAAVVALINAVSVLYFLPKMPATNPTAKLNLFKGIVIFLDVLSDKRTRPMLIVLLLMNLGWGFYFSALPLLLHNLYHYTSSIIALFFAVLAMGNVAGTMIVQPWLLKRYSMRVAGLLAIGVLTILMLFVLWVAHPAVEWVVVALAGQSQLIFYTVIMTFLSNRVDGFEQGKAMGGAGAAMSASWMITGLLTGVLITSSVLLPFEAGAVLLLLSAVYFFYYSRSHTAA